MEAAEFFWVDVIRTRNSVHLSGDLAGMIGDVETGDFANAGSAGEQTIGDCVKGMAKRRSRAHARDPDWSFETHRVFSAALNSLPTGEEHEMSAPFPTCLSS